MYTIHNLIPLLPSPSPSSLPPSLSSPPSPSLPPTIAASSPETPPVPIHGSIQSHLPPTELLKSIGLALAFILPIMVICTVWGVLKVRSRTRERRREEERVRMGRMGLRVLGAQEGRGGEAEEGKEEPKTSRFTKRFERRGARGRKDERGGGGAGAVAGVGVGGEGEETKSRFARFVAVVRGKGLSTEGNMEGYDIEKGVPRIVLSVPAPAVIRADSLESKGGAKGTGGGDLTEGMPVVAYARGESVESRI